MRTFQEFLLDRAVDGRVNLLFETAMYSLLDNLEQIVKLLREAGVAFELIGGVAVNAHLAASEHDTFFTEDIDILTGRGDLQTIIDAAAAAGYAARKMMGGYMLVLPNQTPRRAVHLLFAGERSKTTQPLPHPAVRPEEMQLLGISIPVAPLADLVQMKLTAFRAHDRVHLKALENAGLIEPVEPSLAPVLRERLSQAREEFSQEEPDVE